MHPALLGLELKTSLRAVADLILPRTCVVCGSGLLPGENDICLTCLCDLPETHFATLRTNPMADRFNSAIGTDGYEPYAYAVALFYYSDLNGYGKITQALKYHRNFSVGRRFAALLAERLAESSLYADVDVVIPVPLHWTRRYQRGYNQAEVISKVIASRLGVGCDPSLLRRVRRTASQTTMTSESKRRNVSGVFRCKPSGRDFRHILLVDDVCTSASTLAECHKALRRNFGPQTRISIATLAFVE